MAASSQSLVFVAIFLVSGQALAVDCGAALATPEINECASQGQQKVEAQLNATYKATLAFIDKADPLIRDDAAKAKVKLKEAQRAWITFRAADCDAVYNLNASGTIRTVLWIGCMQSHAEKRILDLESLMNGGAE